MLPGFRFLIAAVMLSLSLMVFGLGAVSLLRSAHEEFASVPIGRAPPEIVFNQDYDNQPRLAMLRVEPPAQLPRFVSQDVPITVSGDPQVATPTNRPAAADLKSSDLTNADLALQPDASAAPSTAASAPDTASTAAATLPLVSTVKPAPELPTVVASIPAVPTSDQTPAVDTAPAPTTAADEMSPAPAVPVPAPIVTAALAPEPAPSDASAVTATTPGTALSPSAAMPAPDATAMASLTDPTAPSGDLVPSDPIPASLVPMPRHRPSATPKKTAEKKKKKVGKPRKVASVARTQTLPAATSASPFD